jgi:hypothetical protein
MWWILQTLIISFIVIFAIHRGFDYIKQQYSTPITKDPVGFQTQKYKAIAQEIVNNQTVVDENLFLKIDEKTDVENDLANYMESIIQS